MSGHSKWSTIKRQKEANDVKRGQLFSKLARAITLAARDGGADSDANIKLRFAIEQARQANMPKANIDRAIERGAGAGASDALEEVLYEGYGPSGVAVMVEAVTDNRNRTAQEIKNLFERGGGSLGGPGSVSYMFEQKGVILIEKNGDISELMLRLIDLGVEDIEEMSDGVEIYVSPASLSSIRQSLEKEGMKVKSVELSYVPKVLSDVESQESISKIVSFLENLDEQDDVQKVYANIDIPVEFLRN